jgi:hypothetical protein
VIADTFHLAADAPTQPPRDSGLRAHVLAYEAFLGTNPGIRDAFDRARDTLEMLVPGQAAGATTWKELRSPLTAALGVELPMTTHLDAVSWAIAAAAWKRLASQQ